MSVEGLLSIPVPSPQALLQMSFVRSVELTRRTIAVEGKEVTGMKLHDVFHMVLGVENSTVNIVLGHAVSFAQHCGNADSLVYCDSCAESNTG